MTRTGKWVRAGGGGQGEGDGRGEEGGPFPRACGAVLRPLPAPLISTVGCDSGETRVLGNFLKLGTTERP